MVLEPEQKQLIELELLERMRAAGEAYRQAVAAPRLDLVDGVASERAALDAFSHALEMFTDLMVRGKTPPSSDLLNALLDQAVASTHADMGNIQVADRDGVLRIVAQRGFAAPFLNFFARVAPGGATSCGEAYKVSERILVSDVTQSPIFMGTTALPVLLDAGVQSVQSTPLVTQGGRVVGVLSTHSHRYGVPDASDLANLDRLAGPLAALIEGTAL
jgi:hypothetical protein